MQMTTQEVGTIPPAFPVPTNVTGELDLTQSLTGTLDNSTAATRGFMTPAPGTPFFSNATQVRSPIGKAALVFESAAAETSSRDACIPRTCEMRRHGGQCMLDD